MKTWKGVITHPKPHYDENVCLKELLIHGDKKYPGIGEAIEKKNVLFLRENEFTMTEEEYEREGWLLIGVGDGPLNEHATAHNEGRKEGKCAATLLSEDLGIDKLPEWKKILQYALVADLGLFTHANSEEMLELKKIHPKLYKKLVSELSTLRSVDPDTTTKLIHEKNPDNPWVAIERDFTAIDAMLAEQYEFHVVAPKVASTARRETIRNISVVSVETDCHVIAKYLRTKEGGRADVIIQKSPTKGNVQIFTSNQIETDLSNVAILLRLVEQKISGTKDFISFEELAREGTIKSVSEWNYCKFEQGEMLLNGSHTAPNTLATKIPLKDIFSAVRIALSKKIETTELRRFVERFYYVK
jgi:hypothetical protein